MIFYFFLIILLVAGSDATVVADTHGNTTTATVTLLPLVCESPQVIDNEKYKCVNKGGGSGSETTPPTFPGGGISGELSTSKISSSSSSDGRSVHDLGSLSGVIPRWIGIVAPWWNDDKITDQEFKNMITFLLDENIIPSDSVKPDIQIGYLSSSAKQIFMLWTENKLAELYIVKIIDQYRHLGIW